VLRGGSDAVHLYIDHTRPPAELAADWTLTHELSHLLHPAMEGEARWLYEGIATYYQNVLRARAGMLRPEQAWEELHAGFRRGIAGTRRNQTLAEASENMLRDRAFMRVYWSGTAIALLADTELRRRSEGRQSLDTALDALRRCCLPSHRRWGAAELLAELDRLTDTRVFSDLYRRHVPSDAFPDLASVYRRLGLEPSGGGLRLDDGAPEAGTREAIMRPPRGGS
jgi:predicted metalloprotease with PDZ domain